MRIKVTAIDLDFTDSVEEITEDQKTQAVNNILQSLWFVENEDDLVDHISDVSGWLVNSLDYDVL